MPFDGIECFANENLQKIDAVIDLIGTPERWSKGRFRTPDGRYCLRAAIRTLDPSETLGPLILDAINQVAWPHYWQIERFNDSPLTNHDQVLTVLMRARANIAAGRFAVTAANPVRPTPFRRCWNRVTAWFD